MNPQRNCAKNVRMKVSDSFLVPAYYTRFRCKGGSCRHTCCEGLAVNITMEEYYRLAGAGCSPELQGKMNVALHLLSQKTPERYGCISPDFFGHCRLLTEDGLCALQSELGFDALPAVCKYFPRSMKFEAVPQCAMANACEGVLELFLEPDLPPVFETIPLTFDLYAEPARDHSDATRTRSEIHRSLVQRFLDFNVPLSARLSTLEKHCVEFHKTINDFAAPGVQNERSDIEGNNRSHDEVPIVVQRQGLPLSDLLAGILDDRDHYRALFRWFGESYDDMKHCAEVVLKKLGGTDSVSITRPPKNEDVDKDARNGNRCTMIASGEAVSVPSEEIFPHYRKLFTHFPFLWDFVNRALANDLFYRYFPYTDGKLSLPEEALAFRYTAGAFVLCLLAVGEEDGTERLIDASAAFFRMVELTDFARNVLTALRS